MAWQKGQDHDGLLEGFLDVDEKRKPLPKLVRPPQPNDCAKCKSHVDIDLHQ